MSVVTIGSNISSLKAQRRLSEGISDLSRTFERLSSGMRINRASDDAAGLSISESLKTDRRVFNQAVRNLNDGVSLLAIADSAVENLTGIVIRLKELAEQSANGTFGLQQRKSLDAEAQALSSEYFRISRSVEFNGLSLFTGSFGELRLQAGYGIDGSILSGLGGAIGTGTFGAAVSYQMESYESNSITLGDLNGDGILDMVSSGFGIGYGGCATVRLGTGDGTFGAAVSYLMEISGSRSIILGDLNGDGILDMVSSGWSVSGGRATVRLGTGDGTFGAAVSYLMESSSSQSITLGDLNGDGILDMVSSGTGVGGGATVRLGTGDGTFGAAVSYQMESGQSYCITLGDLNGDGILDMVSSGSGAGGRATVRLGTGDGTFGTAVSYLMESSSSQSVTLGDLNGDGILDMVSSGYGVGYGGRATVRLGTGDGTFGAAVSYLMESSGSYSITLGDLNGDGILDMVSSGSGAGGRATVRLGMGDGTFGAAVSYQTGTSSSAMAVTLGDINGDGVFDIVTTGDHNLGSGSYASTFLSNTQNGVSPLLPFDLTSRAGALQALPVFTQKLDQLAKQRGTVGAFQSRIEVAVNTLQVASENSAAAASRITDVDVADESSRLTRLNILQQAASSVLAQANLQPSLALTLLS